MTWCLALLVMLIARRRGSRVRRRRRVMMMIGSRLDDAVRCVGLKRRHVLRTYDTRVGT